jgi:very-short-patch-repair endonuclease
LAGAKFHRQLPIEGYVADFICEDAKLIIEIDGGQHCESENDIMRTFVLETAGYRVLRLWNNDVMTNLDGVLERIAEMLKISGQHTKI